MRTRSADRTSIGQAVVEFALILPILLSIILGILDFGRAVWYYNNLAEAAREGTRYSIVHGSSAGSPVGPGSGSYTAPNTDTVVTGIVRRYAFGMDPNQVTVLSTWPDGDNGAGHRVNVEARYTFVPVTANIIGGGSVLLKSVSGSYIVY